MPEGFYHKVGNMSENMFCPNQTVPTPSYKMGWYRSFKGYPKVNDAVWGLITELKDDPRKLLLFFIENVTKDGEYANFLALDVINGVWNG